MSPIQFHLVLNHVPVVGGLIAVALLAYGLWRNHAELIRASLAMIALAAALAIVVFMTGEGAERAVKQLPNISERVIEQHEQAALTSTVLLAGAGLLAFSGLLLFRRRAREIPPTFAAIVLLVALMPAAAMGYTASLGGQIRHTEARPEPNLSNVPATITIPDILRREHAELHAALTAATKTPGRIGEAARAVATVLEPHFAREEQIALPPLGLLVPLSQGVIAHDMAAVLPLTDALRAELPEMLDEHVAIAAAVQHLADVARAAGAHEYVQLADRIRAHAQNEEQITYPAAVVAGELVRRNMAVREPRHSKPVAPLGYR